MQMKAIKRERVAKKRESKANVKSERRTERKGNEKKESTETRERERQNWNGEFDRSSGDMRQVGKTKQQD